MQGWGSRLDQYIGAQLWKMLILSMTLVTLIVFFSDTLFDFLKEMQDLGLPLGLAVQFLILQIPTALAFAFPPSVFFTVFMVYAHLNQHFELVALRMNGLSLWRIFRPALVVGVAVAALTFFSTEWLIPMSQMRLDTLRQEVLSSSQLKLTKDGITLPLFKEGRWVKLIQAEKASLNHLEGFTFIQRSARGNIEVIQANSADYHASQWRLNGVRIFSALAGQDRFVVNQMDHVQKSHLLNVDEDILSQSRLDFHPSKVGFWTLARRIQDQAGQDFPKKWLLALWERLAQPLSTVALMVIAFPLALTPPRQSGAKGFLYAIVTLFSLYIVRNIVISLSLGGALTFGGLLSDSLAIALATFLPSVLILWMGLALIKRKSFHV
jgi:LPS export ABC transporter permease LptG